METLARTSAPAHADSCRLDTPTLFMPTVIEENSRFYATRPAVICASQSVLWTDFEIHTNRVANLLRAVGLRKGDRIALLMRSSIAMFEAIWGAVKAGVVVVPLNLTTTEEALRILLDDARPALLLADEDHLAMVERLLPSLPTPPSRKFLTRGAAPGWDDWVACLLDSPLHSVEVPIDGLDSMTLMYSSGTTGVPKGIEHSHFARQLYQFGCAISLHIDHRAVSICTTSLYANGTWMTMMPTVAAGGTVVLMENFDANEFMKLVEQHRCTHVFMVPTQFNMVLDSENFGDFDLGSLRVLLTAGAPLNRATYDKICEGFPRADLFEMYGMTEGLITSSTPRDPVHGRVGSVGKPIFGGDVRIIDPDGKECPQGRSGEIVAWGAALMKGYYNRPDLTRKILWISPSGRTYLRTGDLGWIDKDGFLYLSGRIKDMIISGGVNVFPSDIEAVFMRHPQVREVAVIGIPHEKWGETPLAFVIRKQGADASELQLKAWANERLGKHQRVGAVEFRTDFPRAGMNKVRKEDLRKPYWPAEAKR